MSARAGLGVKRYSASAVSIVFYSGFAPPLSALDHDVVNGGQDEFGNNDEGDDDQRNQPNSADRIFNTHRIPGDVAENGGIEDAMPTSRR